MKKIIAVILAALFGVVGGLYFSSNFQELTVEDSTMIPSLEEGQKLLMKKIEYDSNTPQKGEVIVFLNSVFAPTGEGKILIKRVIAVPGDTIMITAGIVYVNNKHIKEKYIFSPQSSGEMDEKTVSPGHVFVMGDNRTMSTDSRNASIGMVAAKDIKGKIIFRYFPLWDMGMIN